MSLLKRMDLQMLQREQIQFSGAYLTVSTRVVSPLLLLPTVPICVIMDVDPCAAAADWYISHPAKSVSQRGPPSAHADRYPLLCFIGYFKLCDSYSNDRTVMCTHLCLCVSESERARERQFKQPSLSGFFF